MKQNVSIKNLMSGTNPMDVLVAETRKLVGKWEPSGLLEGLNNDTERKGMAVLLENQAKQLVLESSRTGTAGSEEWSGVALPLVRRIFGESVSKELVSVQPMNLPSGLIFYLDFKYGSGTQPGFKLDHSLFGGDSGSDGTPGDFGRTNSATGGLYGSGRFGYSTNDLTSSSLAGTATSASWNEIDYDADLSASVSAGRIKKIVVTLGGDIDAEAVTAFELLSGSAAVTYYPVHTGAGANGANYTTSFFISSSTAAIADLSSWAVKYHKVTTAGVRGDFEDSSISGSASILDIPELDIQMASEPIIAKTKKLKAVWTPELVQDLNAYHAVDAEAELAAMLSEYVTMEIDLEILEMLVANASATEYWSAKIGYAYNSSTQVFDNTATAGQAYTQTTWFQTLGTKIQKISNQIHQKTLKGGANFMVVSPSVATILESIPGYTVDTAGDVDQFAMGVERVGAFKSRFKVYKNPYMLSNVILLGFKGTSFLDSGAVYAPYIPLVMSPVVYDKDNFTPRRGVMTRYAKKIVRPEFYGRVVVGHLDQV